MRISALFSDYSTFKHNVMNEGSGTRESLALL
jgi:hypothetical protein